MKSFFLLLATYFLLSSYTNAQITYVDINPDLNGTEWNQDIGGTVFATWGGGDAFATDPYSLANPRCMVTTVDNAAILNQGDMISPNSNWNGDAWNIGAITDKYLGIRIGTAGNYKYGWIKASRTAAGVWTIKSYAFQNTLNTAIAAGDMGGGGTNVAVTAITVSGAGGASTITTNAGTLQMNATVAPANATNPAVTWSVQNGTGSATISATGLVTAQTNGTVTVKAMAQDGSNVNGTMTLTISGQGTAIAAINQLVASCHPNPARDVLTLQFNQAETIRSIRISNLEGKLLYKNEQLQKGASIDIATDRLAQGIYILQFENTSGKQGIQRFIKQ